MTMWMSADRYGQCKNCGRLHCVDHTHKSNIVECPCGESVIVAETEEDFFDEA